VELLTSLIEMVLISHVADREIRDDDAVINYTLQGPYGTESRDPAYASAFLAVELSLFSARCEA
jgi:hypothetical protein